MNLEIEYKFVLDKPISDFIKDLNNKGYKVGSRQYEKTVMYDNQARIMQITDGRIRLRTKGEKVSLSYKKPLPAVDGQPKREIEYETSVGNFDLMHKILGTMEFTPSSSYEKYRTTARKDEAELTIDEYPYATFVEIEGEESLIRELAIELGLDISKHLNKPADTLFNEWRKKRGLPQKMYMNFEDYDK